MNANCQQSRMRCRFGRHGTQASTEMNGAKSSNPGSADGLVDKAASVEDIVAGYACCAELSRESYPSRPPSR